MKQTALLTILLLCAIIIISPINAMENSQQKSQQCTLAHAPNNPSLAIICLQEESNTYNPFGIARPQQKLCLYNPLVLLPPKIQETNGIAYHSIASNNDLIVTQTTEGLTLYDANGSKEVKKNWNANLKFNQYCRNQVGLFPHNNDIIILHSIDETCYDSIVYSIELHSLNDSTKRTSSCIKIDRHENNVHRIPLLACHPQGHQVAYKIYKDHLTLHNLLPQNYALLWYLLSKINTPHRTIFNLLPTEIRGLVYQNIMFLLDTPWITKHIPLQINGCILSSGSYNLIKYSPDGNFIALLMSHSFAIYSQQENGLTQWAYSPKPIEGMAFYPYANHILASLINNTHNTRISFYNVSNDNAPYHQDYDLHKIVGSDKTKKIMSFSADGTTVYIASGEELITLHLSEETIERLKIL